MNRKRLFGVALLMIGLGVVLWATLRPARPSIGELGVAPREGSNVVLITLDTTRADFLGCYGGHAEITPVMDSLAQQGVRFTAMQAVAPITLPSHTSMLTGLYPVNHGVRNNGMFSVPRELQTLATTFGEAGYATGAFVSASVLARRYGLDRDFDVYDDDLSLGSHIVERGVPARRGDLTTRAALDWLDGLAEDAPFFLWLHLYDPHAPYSPPPEFAKKFPGDPYSGEIAFTDSLVGQVMGHLQQKELLDTTFVSVVADHGEAFGEHGERTHAILLHQATTLVPWIITGPGVPAGVRVDFPTAGVDVTPTLAALADLPAPNDEQSDGVNVFASHEPAFFDNRSIVTETLLPKFQYGWAPLLGILQGGWQLIDGEYAELFNVANDPRELSNRIDAETTIATALRAQLQPIVEKGDEDTARLELSKSELDQLVALGYAGSEASSRPDPPDPRRMIHAHVKFEGARDFMDRGNDDMAVDALNEALAEDPGNVAMLLARANLHLRNSRLEEAREDFATCMQFDPENASAFAGMARLELQAERYDEAIELAEMGSNKRGAFESLSVIRAIALGRSGRIGEAVELIDERLRANPDDPDLLGYRGELYLQSRKLDKAEEYLRRAVTTDALHSQSRFRLADLLRETDRKPEAVAVLESLLKIEPGNARALAAIGEIKIDDPGSARAYLEESVRLNPSSYEALVNLGRCYLQLGLGSKGEAALRRALEIRPDDLSARNNLAASLILQKRLPAAEKELVALLEEKPSFVEARNNLALTLGRMGRIEEAEAQARQAIATDSSFLDATLTLASILNRSDRNKEAAALLEPFAESAAGHHDFAKQFGIALVKSGRAREAMPWLSTANDGARQPNAEILLALAEGSEATDDRKRAREYYQLAAQAADEPELRDKALSEIDRLATGG